MGLTIMGVLKEKIGWFRQREKLSINKNWYFVNKLKDEDRAIDGGPYIPLALVVSASAWSWSSWERSASVLILVEEEQQHIIGLILNEGTTAMTLTLTKFTIIPLHSTTSQSHTHPNHITKHNHFFRDY